MGISFIPFDGWKPGGGYFGEGWSWASNLYDGIEPGHPWRVFTPAADSVAAGPMTGSYAHLWASGVGTGSYLPDAATVFAGSTTNLYSVAPSTGVFTQISRGGGYAAAGTPAGWRFWSIGNDIYAANWLDVPQRRTNNAGNFADAILSTFVPVPRFGAAIREHSVVANLNQAGRFQDELAWSDADNATNFDPPTGTSTSIAGSKRLVSIPGQITGLLGGEYGLAFKRFGIYMLEYTGTSQVLRPSILSDSVGTCYPSSIIKTRHGVFFRGPDGFYQLDGLSKPARISPPGVDDYLLTFGPAVTNSPVAAWREDTQLHAFGFYGLPLIGWAFRQDLPASANDEVLLYNPITGNWGHGSLSPSMSTLVALPSGADQFDTVGGFTFSGGTTRYARYSTAAEGNYQSVVIDLRFRPANFDVDRRKQSVVKAVMPMFSKTAAFASDALAPNVVSDSALEPFQTGFTSETATPAERDEFGWYALQSVGRLLRVRISMSPAMFETFHGMWIDQEPV